MNVQTISYEPTNITPYVFLDPGSGVFEIKGRSLPDASMLFYKPILSALESCVEGNCANLTVNFAFEYFNTSSSKCVFDIIKTLKTAEIAGINLTINWCFDSYDEDMKETGEDYEELVGLQFNYVPI